MRFFGFKWIVHGLLFALLLAVRVGAAPLPAYVQRALADFVPEVPPGWAYTVTTEQGQRSTTERFDPSRAPTAQWQLLSLNGQTPTPKEAEQYLKYKASQAPGAARATYKKDDIEPFSLTLVREDEVTAEWTSTFREQSAAADKMLAHLRLRLVFTKEPAAVRQATLELVEPYSPVLTVKMNALTATIEFTPATADRPALPVRSSSHFVGRMLLFPVEENLRLTYQDYSRSP